MSEVITSIKNSEIKYLRKLYRARKRRQENKFVLEGTRIIEQAYQAGCSFYRVFVTPDLDNKIIKKLKDQTRLCYISRSVLEEVSDTVTPQGIIAVAERPEYKAEDIFKEENHCLLLLDQLQDPGNMGTLIRTAVASGADAIIALKGCVDIYNLKVLRATMGAVFSIPFITRLECKKLLKYVNKYNYDLVCSDLSASEYYYEPEYNLDTIFVVGNEAHGISSEILNQATRCIKIPMMGEIDSLNAAISGSIVLYEYLKQIKKG